MFDRKKLADYLDLLTPHVYEDGIFTHKKLPLEQLMDTYDLNKTLDLYKTNYGTKEYPLWGPKHLQGLPLSSFQSALTTWPTYGGISRRFTPMSYYAYGSWPMDPPCEDNAKPAIRAETPHEKFMRKVARIQGSTKPQMLTDPRPPAPVRVPDHVGTITAWRGWGVNHDVLTSLGSDSEWEPRVLQRARCRQHESHTAPDFKCACGFWSFKDMSSVVQAMSNYMDEVRVIGTVEIWGRVIECENGYRSEFAYPKELWLLEPGDECLSWIYGVPVRRLK